MSVVRDELLQAPSTSAKEAGAASASRAARILHRHRDRVMACDGTAATVRRMATCESCGADDETLLLVRRVYVTLQTWESEASVRVQPERERWCYSCATSYPNEPVDEPDGQAAG